MLARSSRRSRATYRLGKITKAKINPSLSVVEVVYCSVLVAKFVTTVASKVHVLPSAVKIEITGLVVERVGAVFEFGCGGLLFTISCYALAGGLHIIRGGGNLRHVRQPRSLG